MVTGDTVNEESVPVSAGKFSKYARPDKTYLKIAFYDGLNGWLKFPSTMVTRTTSAAIAGLNTALDLPSFAEPSSRQPANYHPVPHRRSLRAKCAHSRSEIHCCCAE